MCAEGIRHGLTFRFLDKSRKSWRGRVRSVTSLGSTGSFALSFASSRTIPPDADVITQLSRRGTVWRTDVDDDVCADNREKISECPEGKPGDAAMRLFNALARTPTLLKSQAGER